MLLVFFFLIVLIRDRVLLCDLGWPGTGDPFASASAVAVNTSVHYSGKAQLIS